jgi:hypothetical protein
MHRHPPQAAQYHGMAKMGRGIAGRKNQDPRNKNQINLKDQNQTTNRKVPGWSLVIDFGC